MQDTWRRDARWFLSAAALEGGPKELKKLRRRLEARVAGAPTEGLSAAIEAVRAAEGVAKRRVMRPRLP